MKYTTYNFFYFTYVTVALVDLNDESFFVANIHCYCCYYQHILVELEGMFLVNVAAAAAVHYIDMGRDIETNGCL